MQEMEVGGWRNYHHGQIGWCDGGELSTLCLNLDPDRNCHPGVSHARHQCAIPQTDVKLGAPFSGISRRKLNIPQYPS